MNEMNEFIEKINISSKLLSELDVDGSTNASERDNWSQKEILGHLIDSANVNFNRFITAIKKDDLVFDPYPQDDWVKLQNYNQKNWDELIHLWQSLNIHIAQLVKGIPETKFLKETFAHNFDQICWIPIEENTKSNLKYLVNDYIGHLDHHLNKILNYQKD